MGSECQQQLMDFRLLLLKAGSNRKAKSSNYSSHSAKSQHNIQYMGQLGHATGFEFKKCDLKLLF